MSQTQKGFAHMTAFAAVVVLVAAGGVGHYVYNRNNSPRLSQENAAEVRDEDVLPDSLANLKTVDEIRTLAANDLNGASILSIELENDDGTLVFKVELNDGRVLLFDGLSGEALDKIEDQAVGDDDDGPLPANFAAGISLDQARQIALQQRPGKTIVKIQLEVENGVVVFSVRFSDDGRVDVNAQNGTITRVKEGKNQNSSDNSGSENDDDSDDNSGSGSGSNSGSNSGSSGSGSSDDN